MKNVKVKKFKSRSLKIKEMVKPKTIIQQEEEVSEKVSKYLCLFDESNCVKKELFSDQNEKPKYRSILPKVLLGKSVLKICSIYAGCSPVNLLNIF